MSRALTRRRLVTLGSVGTLTALAPSTARAATTSNAPVITSSPEAVSPRLLTTRGANIRATSATSFAEAPMQAKLEQLKADGANRIGLIITFYQTAITDSTFHVGHDTPSVASVQVATAAAKKLGLGVTLVIHNELDSGAWRATICASNPTSWYQELFRWIMLYLNGSTADMLSVGSEMHRMMATNYGVQTGGHTNSLLFAWLIQALRSKHPGLKLTYDSNQNGDMLDGVNIRYDLLDEIWTSFYFWMSGSIVASKVYPSAVSNYLGSLHKKFPKLPILIGEVGFRSFTGAHLGPENWWSNDGVADQTEQAACYIALLQYLQTMPYVTGLMLWDWSDTSGNADTQYSPQGKLAETVISSYFHTARMPNFSTPFLYASVYGGVAAGTSPQLNVSVISPVTRTNAVIDIEGRDSNGQLVEQRYVTGVNLTAHTIYNLAYPAGSGWKLPAGVITFSGGIFNNGPTWTNGSWSSDAGSCVVS